MGWKFEFVFNLQLQFDHQMGPTEFHTKFRKLEYLTSCGCESITFTFIPQSDFSTLSVDLKSDTQPNHLSTCSLHHIRNLTSV